MSLRPSARSRLVGLGVQLDLCCPDPAARAHLDGLLTDLVREPVGRADTIVSVIGSGPWDVSSTGHRARAHNFSQLAAAVLTAVNLTFVASTRQLAVHAAVVARGERVLVVPARSGMGKTTLTGCLLQCGWSYVSDESLCLTWRDGHVVPYPRPLLLSAWSAAAVGVCGTPASDGVVEEQVVGIAGQGWRTARAPGAVTDIVMLQRGNGGPTLEPVSSQDVLAELLRRSFTHFIDPATAITRFAELVGSASCSRLTLGDPRAAATLLTEVAESTCP